MKKIFFVLPVIFLIAAACNLHLPQMQKAKQTKSGSIQTVPAENYNQVTMDAEHFSISPDNQWFAYLSFHTKDHTPEELVLHRVFDNKEFVFTPNDIIATAKNNGAVNNDRLTTDFLQDGDIMQTWSADSKKLYWLTIYNASVGFMSGDKDVSITIKNDTPTVTFDDLQTGQRITTIDDSLQNLNQLTCADCQNKSDFNKRYSQIEKLLPNEFQGLAFNSTNKYTIAISTDLKAYFAIPQDNGFNLMELDSVTGKQKKVGYFYIHGLLGSVGRKTSLSSISISPDDKKIAVSATNNTGDMSGGTDEAWVVDLSGQQSKVYDLGQGQFGDKFFTSDSAGVYFSCAGQTGSGNETGLCMLLF